MVDEHKEISKAECLGCWFVLPGISWKDEHKVRGGWGRPAKNPPMIKLVFFGILICMEKCLNVLHFHRRVLI